MVQISEASKQSCHTWISQGTGTKRHKSGCCCAPTTAGAELGAGWPATLGFMRRRLGSEVSVSSRAALLPRLALGAVVVAGAAARSRDSDRIDTLSSSIRVPSGHVSKRSFSDITALINEGHKPRQSRLYSTCKSCAQDSHPRFNRGSCCPDSSTGTACCGTS